MAQYDRYLEPDVELMPRAEIEALHEQKILELVPYVYERAPIYRSTWDAAGVHPRDISSLDDFRERIPFITKDSVRAFRDQHGDPFGGLLCVEPDDLTAIMASSGTTGDATLFPERFEKWAPLTTGWMRDLWEHGLRPGDHVVGPVGTFRGAGMDDMRQLGCIPISIDLSPGTWSNVLDTIERYQVTYLQMILPTLSEAERIAEQRDMRQALASVKFVSYAGEPLGSRIQATIRDDWDTRLAMWTSAGDTGTAWQCREYDGHHLWEDTVIPETVDSETGDQVGEGDVGELVVTDIDNMVAPLVRFRAEDLVRRSSKTCTCGRSHSRIWPVGRASDLTIVQGKGVLPTEIWSVVERYEETRSALFQIVRPRREVDELRIRVGFAQERTRDVDDLRQRLAAGIESAVGISPVLEMIEEEQMIASATALSKIPRIVKS